MKRPLITSDQLVESDLIIEINRKGWAIKVIKDRKGIAFNGGISEGIYELKTIIIVR